MSRKNQLRSLTLGFDNVKIRDIRTAPFFAFFFEGVWKSKADFLFSLKYAGEFWSR